MTPFIISLVLAASVSTPVRPRVVLLAHANDTPPGLEDALRVQLFGTAVVVAGPEQTGATMQEKISLANSLTATAALVVWVERPSPDEFVLYIIDAPGGGPNTRPRMSVHRLPAADSADASRAIALKIHDALDTHLARQKRPKAVKITTPRKPTKNRNKATRGTTGSHRANSLITEIGARGAISRAGNQLIGSIGIGVARQIAASTAVELLAAGQLASGLSSHTKAGDIEVKERSLAATLRASRRYRRFSIEIGFAIGLRRLSAHGRTPIGTRGSRVVTTPTISPSMGARVWLSPTVQLRVGTQLDVAATRQRFGLNDSTLLDVGRVRPSVGATVLLGL